MERKKRFVFEELQNFWNIWKTSLLKWEKHCEWGELFSEESFQIGTFSTECVRCCEQKIKIGIFANSFERYDILFDFLELQRIAQYFGVKQFELRLNSLKKFLKKNDNFKWHQKKIELFFFCLHFLEFRSIYLFLLFLWNTHTN